MAAPAHGSAATVTGVSDDASPPSTDPSAEHPFRERLHDAAITAEMMTGSGEDSVEAAEKALHRRLARGALGMVLVIVGVVLLPLPGPGWVIILVGLTQLPFAWAERTVLIIRRRIPGVPESGEIPTHTWIIMGTLVVGTTAAAVLWGGELKDWVSSLW